MVIREDIYEDMSKVRPGTNLEKPSRDFLTAKENMDKHKEEIRKRYNKESLEYRLMVAIEDKWPRWVSPEFLYDLLESCETEINGLKCQITGLKGHVERLKEENKTVHDDAVYWYRRAIGKK